VPAFQPPLGVAPAPATPYAPEIAPNPPETGGERPPAPEAAAKAKAGPGRPKGVRNKGLSTEEQVFAMGVAAAISNPNWDGKHESLAHAGALAIYVFNVRFEK
jgi:hypothetical protein